MKSTAAARGLLYALSLAGVAYSAKSLLEVDVSASATCCQYSENCPGSDLCCLPPSGTADCSANQANYCKASCS
jgi:hypothetical protein